MIVSKKRSSTEDIEEDSVSNSGPYFLTNKQKWKCTKNVLNEYVNDKIDINLGEASNARNTSVNTRKNYRKNYSDGVEKLNMEKAVEVSKEKQKDGIQFKYSKNIQKISMTLEGNIHRICMIVGYDGLI